MSKGDIGSVVDTLEFDTADGTAPNVIHVVGDVYCVVYVGSSTTGIAATFTIDKDGNIGAAVLDTLTFEATTCLTPRIKYRGADVFIVVYEGVGQDGFLKTFTISSSGIFSAVLSTFEYDTARGSEPDLIQISGSVWCVAYSGDGADGFLATVTIDAAGTITGSTLDTLEFDTTFAAGIHILNVSGDIWVVTYRRAGSSNLGIITIDIDSAGTIAAAATDSANFRPTGATFFPKDLGQLVRVGTVGTDAIYALVYIEQAPGNDGFVVTFGVTAAGTIDTSDLDSFEFDTVSANTGTLLGISGSLYAILDDDNIRTVNISSSGVIGPQLATLQYDSAPGSSPHAILVVDSKDIVAIVFTGADSDGFVKTVAVTTLLAGYLWIESETLRYIDENKVERFLLGSRVDHAGSVEIMGWLGF